jgi:hypothetical protein
VAESEWTIKVDIKPVTGIAKLLRHHSNVVAVLTDIATQVAASAEAGHKEARYGIIVQNKAHTNRARALIHPLNSAGIHVELTQHAMLKAAAGSQHKTIPLGAKPSTQAQAIAATDNTDSAAAVGAGGTIEPVEPIEPTH